MLLTLNLLTTTIVAPPSNASKWQIGFNSVFKGLNRMTCTCNLCSYVYKTKKFVLLTNNLFYSSVIWISAFGETVNKQAHELIYEACPESNDTKVLNMYNIFNLQNVLPVHNFVFQHSRRHCTNIY